MKDLIANNILREKYSSRGGGIEIDLTDFGYNGEKMTTYQNYLGGGMLGSVNNDCTISGYWQHDNDLQEIQRNLNEYYCEQIGADKEDFSNRPTSAY